ncbi:hypothetical protein SAMN05518672_103141 [Chitinophaga sp. CF118]|uniref:hypothetical protein n=1 Tax=Chitinophaga sp. CF118 TaxID=1884367 RepID=UPI0008DFD5A2|nr:hypothetical protein [Chitinophaga sp. CF118]SFD76796.1 hypothetical protein SAMN05518672_103141 [Chitinophaga sp. CF118]
MKARISKLGEAFLRNSKAAKALSDAVFNNRELISNGEPVKFQAALASNKKAIEYTVRKVNVSLP